MDNRMEEDEKPIDVSQEREPSVENVNSDEKTLAEPGYKSELKTEFSLISCLAFGFSIANSWLGVSGALVTGISNGGATIYVWGTWLMFTVHLAVGASLGELASAYPHSGGQYFWVSQLAPKDCRRFLSYFTGVVSWAGATVTGASVSLVLSQFLFGIIIINSPTFVYKPWMGFIAYQVINFLTFFLNCFSHLLPFLTTVSFYMSLSTFIVSTIVLLAVSQEKASPVDVFGKGGYVNMSGWESNAANFFTGLLGVNWGFSCLDACVHLSEEIPSPSRNIPKAILGTVFIGLITSWIYSITIFFVITDIEVIITTPTGVPILQVFYNALRDSRIGASILLTFLCLCLIGSLMAIHTWMCRLTSSFSRDNGFPFSNQLSKVASAPYNTPIIAHIFGSLWIALLGTLYLASNTAFNSLVTAGILMQYVSYMIPVGLLMLRGRDIGRRGSFWLGKKTEAKGGALGWIANGILMLWGGFTCVIYSLPYMKPVSPGNMNYVSVVMVGIFVYAVIYWLVKGKRHFKTFEKVNGVEPVPLYH